MTTRGFSPASGSSLRSTRKLMFFTGWEVSGTWGTCSASQGRSGDAPRANAGPQARVTIITDLSMPELYIFGAGSERQIAARGPERRTNPENNPFTNNSHKEDV